MPGLRVPAGTPGRPLSQLGHCHQPVPKRDPPPPPIGKRTGPGWGQAPRCPRVPAAGFGLVLGSSAPPLAPAGSLCPAACWLCKSRGGFLGSPSPPQSGAAPPRLAASPEPPPRPRSALSLQAPRCPRGSCPKDIEDTEKDIEDMKGSGDGRCAQPLTAAGCRGSCAPAGAAARFWPSSLLLSLTAPGRAPGDGLPASDGHPKVLRAEKTAWVCISPCTLCRAKRGLCLAQRQRQCLCHEHPGETRVWNSPQTFPSHKDRVGADPAMGCHGWLSGWPLKCPQSRFSALALPFRLLGEAWAPLLPASPRCTAEPGTCTGRGCPPAAPAAAGVSRQPPRAHQGQRLLCVQAAPAPEFTTAAGPWGHENLYNFIGV